MFTSVHVLIRMQLAYFWIQNIPIQVTLTFPMLVLVVGVIYEQQHPTDICSTSARRWHTGQNPKSPSRRTAVDMSS